ncbi:diguanylate cyclase/phosphodiesterase [Magnetococcus marinus MC-1]|uniref:Diguanylate cyclase/phosphodiesterase n=1 Tax=Magnetococcus marinus (strain ATCC BAA-1437 / JCM 17883 / MC-1) TaxID=156889 RepID=A0LA97_MAGMM|nr:EAL domain-containing protein [Magnetococcus marinus]ABK44890.1 diguanylate cyclase/phosphodiesterase [Magnetococcus marinus MC-1]
MKRGSAQTQQGVPQSLDAIQVEGASRQQLELFRALLDQAPDMILLVRMQPNLPFVDANGLARQKLSLNPAENVQHEMAKRLGKALVQRIWDLYGEGGLSDEDRPVNIESSLDLQDHARCPVEVSLRCVTLQGQRYGVLIIRDVHIRKDHEEAILQQANFDTLTGLPNRTIMLDRLGQAIFRAQRGRARVGLICLDLDRFKQVNDFVGHSQGDDLLKQVTQRLKGCIRSEDTLARAGGDKFVAILQQLHEPAQALMVAEKMLDVLRQPLAYEDHQLVVTASVGLTLYPDNGLTPEVLFSHGDRAMYQAKEDGRNCLRFYTAELDQVARTRIEIESHLRQARVQGELSLVYQPLVDLQRRQIIGAETLLRWTSARLGEMSPEHFIPIAEDSGAIQEIGTMVLQSAFVQGALWARQMGAFRLSVNVSVRQFKSPDFVPLIAGLMAEAPPELVLDLELTEHLLMEDDHKVAETLLQLKKLGVHLSIDDFGTGYSSLSYLKQFPIDILKIDRAFVRDVDQDENSASLTRAILSMAKSLNLDIVAEGIERPQHLDFLLKHACPWGQGYLFSEPVQPARFDRLLLEGLPRDKDFTY